ncbi:MAG: class I SAM-dependent methyltransferase [Candidatus Methylomirabilis sp.]
MPSTVIDGQNAEFWNEICGSAFAHEHGITDVSPESLHRFDEVYLRYYPYLERYVTSEDLKNKRVLEIGLGYGTLGQLLASKGCRYHGLDIAMNPVALMRYRFGLQGLDGDLRVGSVLDLPYRDAAFDYVYSIGCLHHTGDLNRAVSEVHRVLADGGKAIIMLYNRHSFRRMIFLPVVHLRNLLLGRYKSQNGRTSFSHWVRTWYDKNTQGEAAPHTDYVSRAEVRRLFRGYRTVRIESQNFDPLVLKERLLVRRERFLNNLARVAGVDLYITAVK